jgi:pyridoxal phosphate enzyme (YggS family)
MTASSPREDLRERVARVLADIAAACARAGRDPAEVTLVAVTKEHPADVVAAGLEAGLTDFGENYVAELVEKRGVVAHARWHFIGTLQGRSAPAVAEHADVVHSAVPGRAVERLARRAQELGRSLPVLVQVDYAGRGTAVTPDGVEAAIESLRALPGLRVAGLMTLPPPGDPQEARPVFARLRKLRDDLRIRAPEVQELSMGMSLDYEIAVEEGATMVRVGTALFGPRMSTASG